MTETSEPHLNEIPNLWLFSQNIAGIFQNSTHFCLQCLQMGEVHQHTILEIILFPQHWNIQGCFINVSPAVQNILSKLLYCRNHTSWENFKLKLCTCAQSDASGTCTKFQLEILTINGISGIVYLRKIILESLRTTPSLPPLSLLPALLTSLSTSTVLSISPRAGGDRASPRMALGSPMSRILACRINVSNGHRWKPQITMKRMVWWLCTRG